MSWQRQLVKTYNNNIQRARNGEICMAPIAHMYTNAQVEVAIGADANFVSARVLDSKDDSCNTLIPVTEDSAGRTNGESPHALNDLLPYVAGDFKDYCENEKMRQVSERKFGLYITSLREWCESSYHHPKANIILQYLSKKTLAGDLIRDGCLQVNGKYLTEEKIGAKTYDKVMVRFVVDGEPTWTDNTLIDTFMDYYTATRKARKEICFLTGEEKSICEKHPKGVIASDFNAKLISACDDTGFTYRGRFHEPHQAFSMGFEESQKIHNALFWLTRDRGIKIGDNRTYVCWSPSGKKVPDIFHPGEIGEWGLEPDDDVVIIGLEASTKGRLAIVDYNEFPAYQFLEKIDHWRETCRWQYISFTEDKKPYYEEKSPSLWTVLRCIYGRENANDKLVLDDVCVKSQMPRLIKCVLNGHPMPYDMVNKLVANASSPMSYCKKNNQKILSTACAVIRKYYIDTGGERALMALDTENRDRDYLYGRLLAVYEVMERMSYDRTITREPNAVRYRSAFVAKPAQIWNVLESKTMPYLKRLCPAQRYRFRILLEEITGLFREEDGAIMEQRLGSNYLLGYFSQREELYKKHETQEETEGKAS